MKASLTQGWGVYCFCRRQIQFTNTRAVDIPKWELGKPDACVVMGWAAECRKPLFEQKSRGMRSLKTPRLSATATLGARRLNSRPKFPFKNTRRHWDRSCQPTIQRETMDFSKQQQRCLTYSEYQISQIKSLSFRSLKTSCDTQGRNFGTSCNMFVLAA